MSENTYEIFTGQDAETAQVPMLVINPSRWGANAPGQPLRNDGVYAGRVDNIEVIWGAYRALVQESERHTPMEFVAEASVQITKGTHNFCGGSSIMSAGYAAAGRPSWDPRHLTNYGGGFLPTMRMNAQNDYMPSGAELAGLMPPNLMLALKDQEKPITPEQLEHIMLRSLLSAAIGRTAANGRYSLQGIDLSGVTRQAGRTTKMTRLHDSVTGITNAHTILQFPDAPDKLKGKEPKALAGWVNIPERPWVQVPRTVLDVGRQWKNPNSGNNLTPFFLSWESDQDPKYVEWIEAKRQNENYDDFDGTMEGCDCSDCRREKRNAKRRKKPEQVPMPPTPVMPKYWLDAVVDHRYLRLAPKGLVYQF